jgi:small multidrug resistance pump
MVAVLITIFLALAAVASDAFLKIASESPRPFANWQFLAGFLIYGLTAFGWVLVMPHLKLAYIGVIFCLTMVLGLCVLGMFFGETLKPREWLGVAMAGISMLLLYQRIV